MAPKFCITEKDKEPTQHVTRHPNAKTKKTRKKRHIKRARKKSANGIEKSD